MADINHLITRKFTIATADCGVVRGPAWTHEEVTWSDFVNECTHPQIRPNTQEQFAALTDEQRGAYKRALPSHLPGKLRNNTRNKRSVLSRSVLMLDVDHSKLTIEDLQQVLIDKFGFAFCLYPSISHGINGETCVRIAIPLAEDVIPAIYRPLALFIMALAGIELFDTSACQPERFFFRPATLSDTDYQTCVHDGPLLNAVDFLSTTTWQDDSTWPRQKGKKRYRAFNGDERKDPRLYQGDRGVFNRAWTIPEVLYELVDHFWEPVEGDPTRFTRIGSKASGGGHIFNNGQTFFSHYGSDPFADEAKDAYEIVLAYKYEGDIDAMQEFLRSDPAFMAEVAATEERDRSGFDVSIPDETVDDDVLPLAPLRKIKPLLRTQGNNPTVKPHVFNLVQELRREPYNGKIRMNSLSNVVCIVRDIPEQACDDLQRGTPLKETAIHDIWHEACFHHRATFPLSAMHEAIHAVAIEAPYCPVQHYLESLVWDGVERIATLLSDYMGCVDDEYHRDVSNLVMRAGVGRILNPGCKYDSMPLLVGPQAAGKSTFCAALMPYEDWFSDTLSGIDDPKKAMEAMDGKWLIEMSELTAFGRKEHEHQKAFLSRQVDTARMAYGRTTERRPRRCTFFGTTNDAAPLDDLTGSRRFMPVDVCAREGKGPEWIRATLTENRSQLWAEASVKYAKNPILRLDNERLAARVARGFVATDPWQDDIFSFMNGQALAGDLDVVGMDETELGYKRDRACAKQVAAKVLGSEFAGRPIRAADLKRINLIMESHEDFTMTREKRRFGDFGRTTRSVYRVKNG